MPLTPNSQTEHNTQKTPPSKKAGKWARYEREKRRIEKAGSWEERQKQKAERSRKVANKKKLQEILDRKKSRAKKNQKTPFEKSGGVLGYGPVKDGEQNASSINNLKNTASPQGGEAEWGGLGTNVLSPPLQEPFTESLLRNLGFVSKRFVDAIKDKLPFEDWLLYEKFESISKGLYNCGYKGLDKQILALYDVEGEVCTCGHKDDERQTKKERKKAAVLGAFGCGRTNYCPKCGLRKSLNLAEEVYSVILKWKQNFSKGLIVMVTIGYPSRPTRQFKESIDLHKAVRDFSRKQRETKKFRVGNGIVGYADAIEMMFSENKVHTHTHSLYFIEGADVSDEKKKKEFELSLSNNIRDFYEECLRKVVAKARLEKKDAYSWINLDKKEIIVRPFVKDGRIRGGVTAEIARNDLDAAKYLCKEISMGASKSGFGEDGDSYSWVGLLANVNTIKWAPRVLHEYLEAAFHMKSFTWSQVGRKGFNNYVLNDLPGELPDKKELKLMFLGEIAKEDMQYFNEQGLKGNFALESIVDALTENPDFDFEKASEGKIKRLPQDEASQKEMKQKYLEALKVHGREMAERRKEKLAEMKSMTVGERMKKVQARMLKRKEELEKKRNSAFNKRDFDLESFDNDHQELVS